MASSAMRYAFLPFNEAMWLCAVEGEQVVPLSPAPGELLALRKFSADGTGFVFLDQAGKRVGCYRLLEVEPWLEVVVHPLTLPKSCFAHDVILHDGLLIAGGHGKSGEALWKLRPQADAHWQSVALPEGVGTAGKSIDALFVRGDELIAVDNRIVPKWILVYALSPELTSLGVEKIRLRSHTSYERVHDAAEGTDTYALRSSGYNHGRMPHYLALLQKSTLKEIALWSGATVRSTQEIVDEINFGASLVSEDMDFEGELPLLEQFNTALKLLVKESKGANAETAKMLASVKDMSFCGDHLVLALGESGVMVADTAFTRATGEYKGTFERIRLTTLVSVERLVPGSTKLDGMYALGRNGARALDFEWIGRDRLAWNTKLQVSL